MDITDDDRVANLDQAECWELLRSQELGRLAFTLAGETHIVPINFAVDGQTLLFNTAPGEKLLSIALGTSIAFEVDEVGDSEARSVVVRGSMRRLEEDEAHRAERVHLRPWIATEKYEVLELMPSVVTGRWFRLDRG